MLVHCIKNKVDCLVKVIVQWSTCRVVFQYDIQVAVLHQLCTSIFTSSHEAEETIRLCNKVA